jgi:glycosyltransferase involved in cell wall biosynthesis
MIHVSCFEDRSKNISGILFTLKKLSDIRTDWECQMVGDGEDFEKIVQLSKDMDLYEKYVNFTGLLEGKSLIEAYQKSDFLVMYSNYENLPVVINEAFSCGLPVISSNVGGISEVLSKDRGILVEPGTEENFLDLLNVMLDGYGNYNNSAIRNFAVKYFSKQAVSLKMKEIYQQILN